MIDSDAPAFQLTGAGDTGLSPTQAVDKPGSKKAGFGRLVVLSRHWLERDAESPGPDFVT